MEESLIAILKNDNILKKWLEPWVKKKPIGWNKLIINEYISIKIENYDWLKVRFTYLL